MNTPAILLPIHVSTSDSEPPRAAPRRRSPVERLRKPASWLAVALIGWLWLRLEPARAPMIAFAAELAGFAAVMTAVLGRVWCALYIAGRKNAELCQDGPYSFVRNPLYVFSFVGAVGVAVWAASEAALEVGKEVEFEEGTVAAWEVETEGTPRRAPRPESEGTREEPW